MLTGAGISAESGLKTFRDGDGLWENHAVEEVATPEAWQRDPALVWRFYSDRRAQAAAVQPNAAHQALAQLEAKLSERFFLCTQNVDDLHERSGCTSVVHMHGCLFESRLEREACASCPYQGIIDDRRLYQSLDEVPRCACRHRLRPHICWFGEVPFAMDLIMAALNRCTVFITIGSSGSVYPAAGFVSHLAASGRSTRRIYIGPEAPDNAHAFSECYLGTATAILPALFQLR